MLALECVLCQNESVWCIIQFARSQKTQLLEVAVPNPDRIPTA